MNKLGAKAIKHAIAECSVHVIAMSLGFADVHMEVHVKGKPVLQATVVFLSHSRFRIIRIIAI